MKWAYSLVASNVNIYAKFDSFMKYSSFPGKTASFTVTNGKYSSGKFARRNIGGWRKHMNTKTLGKSPAALATIESKWSATQILIWHKLPQNGPPYCFLGYGCTYSKNCRDCSKSLKQFSSSTETRKVTFLARTNYRSWLPLRKRKKGYRSFLCGRFLGGNYLLCCLPDLCDHSSTVCRIATRHTWHSITRRISSQVKITLLPALPGPVFMGHFSHKHHPEFMGWAWATRNMWWL